MTAFALLLALGCSCSRPPARQALLRLEREAARGIPQAQFELGLRYRQGVDVPEDASAALVWFRKAANQGHAGAQWALGSAYLNGEGVMLPDAAEAAKWFRRSAEQEYAPAQDQLAALCAEGIGVPRDDAEAVKWATRAAEQGYPEAQFRLGTLLFSKSPRTVHRDLVAAYMWVSLATKAGWEDPDALSDALEAELTPAQLTEARQRIAAWEKKHSQSAKAEIDSEQ